MTSKTIIIAVAVIVVVAAAIIGGYLLTATTVPQKELTSIKVQLPWLIEGAHAHYLIPIEKGWYKEMGFDKIEVLSGGEVASPIKLLALGKVDFLRIEMPGLISARLQGLPVRAIAAECQSTPTSFISLKKTGINGPKDLPGHTIGIRVGDDNDYTLRALLQIWQKDGTLTKEQVDTIKIIPTGFSLEPLLAGTIDVYPAWFSDTTVKARMQGFELNEIKARDYGFWTYSAVTVTTDTMIKEHPVVVKDFLRATMKGMYYMLDPANDQEVMDITMKYAEEKNREFNLENLRLTREFLMESPDTKAYGLGWMNTQVWTDSQAMFYKYGAIEGVLPIDDYYTMDFLKQIYTPNGTLIWPK